MLSPARSAWCTKKLNSIGTLIQRTTTEAPQGHMYYIGLDVHKKEYPTSAAGEPGQHRATTENGIRPGQFPTAGPFAGGANQTPQDRSWSRTDHGADLGTGNGRGFAFPLDPRSHQLLRALR